MAIRIISEKPDPKVAKRITCKKCGARLEYFPVDVQEYHGKDIGGGPDGMEWIDCPKCKQRILLRSW